MDVRLVSDEGVEQRPVEELQALLQREDGLVWVDIPACDEEAVRVLAGVFGFHPLAIRARQEWPRPLPRARPVRRPRYLVTVHGPLNPAVPPDVALRSGAVAGPVCHRQQVQ